MVTVMQAAGLTVTAVLTAKLLERYAKEQALLLTLLTGIALTAASVCAMAPVLNRADELLAGAGLTADQTARIGKALGICCISELAAGVCQDAGESALKTAVILGGRAALLILTLPLIDPVIQLLRELLE